MTPAPPRRLSDYLVPNGDSDTLLERFLEWAMDRDLELYPAQEEAVLEVMAGKHVVLNTPTGSGKSLVALAMHYKQICEGGRCYYTSPIKALASEKFFDLCDELGAENVGMMTGDASINPKAPIICCTAEILANIALREGRYTRANGVVMDEFHYYADRDRGWAWQVPLLLLADTTFMLMSATLGDVRDITDPVERLTGAPFSVVRSKDRPVPLRFQYSKEAIHDALHRLVREERAPVYLVNFTQREAAEQAQNLLSVDYCSKGEKRAIKAAVGDFRFDTPFGKDIRRLVLHGVGLHHAGLLPKYRRLVETLAQKGMLKIISGTDTLGVGVNVPIRTVLFTKLCKFDGESVRILSVRDFQQISGRAGRKGFDEQGFVVCQAPEHVIENEIIAQKLAADPKKKRKTPKKKPPTKGYVHYDAKTFQTLIDSDPEKLQSRFVVNHSILMNLLERELTHGRRDGGYRKLVQLVAASHESPKAQRHHRRHAANLVRSLLTVGILERHRPDFDPQRPYLRVREGLQRDFSLFQTLATFLIEALDTLEGDRDDYAVDLVSYVESILENPRIVLLKQEDRLKGELIAQLKAEGVEYDERMARLQEVTHPKPCADAIYEIFNAFREAHPWVRHENVQPKSVVRDMFERYASFHSYVRDYGLQRSEGVLLRYLSQAYKALVQTVPPERKTEGVDDIVAFLRTMLGHVDTSLISEWESLLGAAEAAPEIEGEGAEAPVDLLADPRAFRARVRAEVHRLVKALADRHYEDVATILRPGDGDSEPWTAERLEGAMAEFYATHERLIFDHRARLSEMTHLRELAPRVWQVQQTLVDSSDENLWAIEAQVDLREAGASEGPLLSLVRIGT